MPALPGPGAEDSRGVLGHRDPFTELLVAAAETRVVDAARTRARVRELAHQAGQEGTVAGILADLGERGVPVIIETVGGRRHRGAVRAVGEDFAALVLESGATALVATRWLALVRTPPDAAPLVSGDRPLQLGQRLGDLLGELVPDHLAVVVGLPGGQLHGVVRAVGHDVMTVSVTGAASPAYVSLGAVTDLVVDLGDGPGAGRH